MVVLVTCKSLNALQRLEGFVQPLNRLCRRLNGLTQTNVHAVLRVGSGTKETGAESFTWDIPAQVPDPAVTLGPQTDRTQAPTHRICCLGVL